MRYAQFNTYEEAFDQLEIFNNLARSETTIEPFSLTSIFELGNYFYFNFDDCIEHGGNNKEQIADCESTLTIVEEPTE